MQRNAAAMRPGGAFDPMADVWAQALQRRGVLAAS